MSLTRTELLRKGMGLAAGALLGDQTLLCDMSLAAREPGVALLCGMDSYPYLSGPGRNLHGAGSTSANLLRQALGNHTFPDVHFLQNPTKTQILEAIRTKSRPDRPFLFYFVGHGSRDINGNGTLLAADALDGHPETSLRRDELRHTLTDIIREHRAPVTCLIHACESWAVAYEMAPKGQEKRGECLSLSYNLFGERIVQTQPSQPQPAASRDPLLQPCFLTAADAHERAYVAPHSELGGRWAGIFSFQLARCLSQASAGEVWGALHENLLIQCGRFARAHRLPYQTPKLTPIYGPVPLFEPKPGDAIDLCRFFELEAPDAQLLSLHVITEKPAPNPSLIKTMENFRVRISARTSGYLIALERTPDGGHALQFPLSGEVKDARIPAGALDLPAGPKQVYFHDQPGPDTFKVFLYSQAAGANELLESLGKIKTEPLSEKESDGIRLVARADHSLPAFPNDVITATFQFYVRP
jgi:hypothetical protein